MPDASSLPVPDAPSPKSVIRTYLAITGVSTLSSSLIWGVNTLFLLAAGLDIFQVLLANAAFTLGQLVFEVPTGVVADTVGRRASFILSTVTIAVGTAGYLWAGLAKAGLAPFVAASILLGLGFTFYTGAVDAWLVDALRAVGYEGAVDPVFARAGIVFGISMLIGTITGGLLGQVALWIPYAVRVLLCVPAILVGVLAMREMGFTPRPLKLSHVGAEMSTIARAGATYGLRHKVVRPLVLASFVSGLFAIYGFYSWQRYFLDLLGRELVWVAGVIAALVGLSQIVGNMLVGPIITRARVRRSTVLIVTGAVQAACIVGAGLTRDFSTAVALYLVAMVGFGLAMPVKGAWLNACIPSEQRATLISFDALMADGGGTIGQVGLGYLSRQVSIPFAWVVGGLTQFLVLPLLGIARHAAGGPEGEGCGFEDAEHA